MEECVYAKGDKYTFKPFVYSFQVRREKPRLHPLTRIANSLGEKHPVFVMEV